MTFDNSGPGASSAPQNTTYPPSATAPERPPASGAPSRTPPTEGRNTLALVALITSVIGFVFACIPGALIIGWILLPIAFILAIVSLFLRGRGKALGIVGLVVSVIGTIVAVAVFFSVVADSFSNAFGSSEVSVNGADADADAPAADEPAAEEPAAAGEAGTRENPVAIGSVISSDDWSVTVDSYTTDGSAVVAAANQFNDPAPAGSHYEIVTYTVTYTGEGSANAMEVGVDLVTAGGNVVKGYESLVVLEDGFGLDELFTGASATGSDAFTVLDGDSALVRVQPGMFADEVFVKP